MRARLTRGLRWLAIPLACLLAASLTTAGPAHAATFAELQADGSSWAEPAIDQWSRDVFNQGIRIDFSGDGSAAGRQHYIVNQADFAASDIAFLTSPDPFGAGQEDSAYAYSYLPIVAGGTALMYNLVVGGKKITNLRLSGDTITKIFTGQITNWSDSRISHDYGATLPSQKITVVTRSDGSGASYMFSQWMSKQYTSQWNAFCRQHGGPSPCPPTEFYPAFAGSVQRNGSDQVANYVASPSFGVGSIGYDEYAYALNSKLPVVKVLNKAGYYALPTASNVAIALQLAQIDENPNSLTFLMQNLDKVYTNPDSRTYPISSYSYLIVPRVNRTIGGQTLGPPPRFNNTKGATLSTWLNYVLCGAQQKAGDLGYSPLPKNLVVGGFEQVDNIPGHVATPDTSQLNGCNNPTYHDGVNHLIVDAPKPSPCDKVGAPLNCTVVGGKAVANNSGGGSGSGGSGSGGSGSGGTGAGGTTPSGAPSGSVKIDPDTGLPIGTDQADAAGTVNASPVFLSRSLRQSWVYATLTAVDILLAIAIPGALGAWLRRRRRVRT
ncbi:substrate-binding domain-containing protein [Rugosimonospora africana]|uniref:Phosphate ABC transporter substrate-binding protein PstS n=1 Tax=Rugosimonospora africana TaxID=556532 RepID=A0A8J3R1E3_9ACTN|nr:substrate-binding domain-containing protein [Rugosimonospora africana]GIH19832.1 phosphate ABC transporter substrate-binding protein PstS [Rugosimonospora africana]